MKKIVFQETEYQGDKLYQTQDSIKLIMEGSVVFEAKGIKDWSQFQVEGSIDVDENELMNQRLKSTEDALLFLMDMMGGM